MKRRDFLLGAAAGSAALALRAPRAETAAKSAQPGWRTFEVVTRVDIAEPVGTTRLWLPLPMRQPTDYQRILNTHWDAPGAGRAKIVAMPHYGVELLAVEWSDEHGVGTVTATSQVQTRDRRVAIDAGNMKRGGDSTQGLREFLRPTRLLPTDGIVKSTATQITAGQRTDIDKARAIYEWVVENTSRDPKTPGCGVGDVASMLETNHLSGKCADINALFVALARAANIPARDAYGVRVADSRLDYHCLGRSGDVSKAQHCRAEFHARGHGWIPVDPADVRKLMLEEAPGGLPATDPKVQSARAFLFGNWEMNWIAYNHGHDIALPGSDRKPVPFLMYPNGATGERQLNSLDPAAFRYSITSREIVA
ncbi:MAG TPA: transglutaminase domain-containing protein [Dokdonella sp.]